MISIQWNPDEQVRTQLNLDHSERYLLSCRWDEEKPRITFVFAHPPFGDEQLVGSTLRTCVDWAKEWGYGTMEAVSLIPELMVEPFYIVEPLEEQMETNDVHIIRSVQDAERVVFAWGDMGSYLPKRVDKVKALVPEEKRFCLSGRGKML
ncbi:DUF1643 domain-containing protein [Rossellomorea marisflavi]|uniref:DUF1643 domain-containing protein n=1 Tax=Rossellomorea marisflavi TaxID=189381 RepID=UPI003512B9A3